jgi:hypothetical protein
VQEYLVAQGKAGEIGRFRAAAALICSRGDRVVIQGRGGLELGSILCEAGLCHARLLGDTPVGQLLRLATPDDEQTAAAMIRRAQALFEDSRRLAGELGLASEILDAEVSLDGGQGTIYFLAEPGLDLDALARPLSRRHELFIFLHNLAPGSEPHESDEGCGEPNCGRKGGGGCTNCSSEGGCATGCGSGPTDLSAYFAHLRTRMDQRNFTPLL